MTSDRRDRLLFTGWLLTGACASLALLALLSIGLWILPFALAAAAFLASRRGTGRGMPGLLSGASLPLFFLAYLNRQGPGTHCTTSATGGSCTDGLIDPWIPAGAGVLVLIAGVVLFVTLRQRRSEAR